MKRTITAAILLATMVCPAFAAVDAFIWFDAPGGKQMKIQVQNLKNPAITQTEFSTGKLAPGHRKWAPFQITKTLDSSSPLFFRTLSKGGGNLDIEQVTTGPNGKTTSVFKIHLTGVKGSKGQSRKGQTNTFEVEDFSFTFQKITWTWTQGGVTAQDDWEART